MIFLTLKSNHIRSCSGVSINFSRCLQSTAVTWYKNTFDGLKTKTRISDLCWKEAFSGNAMQVTTWFYSCRRKIIHSWYIPEFCRLASGSYKKGITWLGANLSNFLGSSCMGYRILLCWRWNLIWPTCSFRTVYISWTNYYFLNLLFWIWNNLVMLGDG